MKTRFTWTSLLIALLPLPAIAQVELSLGPCISVKAVHGTQHTATAGQTLSLENGIQQLIVECTTEMRRHDVLEASDAFVLKFEAANTELALTAPEIRSRRDMEQFNQKGNWRLSDGQGQPVAFTADVLEKEGFQLLRDYSRELAAYNRSGAAAAIDFPAATAGAEMKVNQDGLVLDSQAGADQEMVSRMLRYWYQKADDETRSEWKGWIHSSNQ